MTTQPTPRARNRDGAPDQIPLIAALSKELTRQGYPYANHRQLNALVAAADLVVREYGRPHQPAEPGSGIEAWVRCDDTGNSSVAMARMLTRAAGLHVHGSFPHSGDHDAHPHDPADLGRCLGLLDAVPELRPHLPRMADVSPAWAALVAAWGELEETYREELPTGSAPRCYARMRAIIEGVEKENRDHA